MPLDVVGATSVSRFAFCVATAVVSRDTVPSRAGFLVTHKLSLPRAADL